MQSFLPSSNTPPRDSRLIVQCGQVKCYEYRCPAVYTERGATFWGEALEEADLVV